MSRSRAVTLAEIERIEALGTIVEDWSRIEVSDDFRAEQIVGCHLRGCISLGSNSFLVRSNIANYNIGDGVRIEYVTAMECRGESSFGNGVRVATINENGGRSIPIYDTMTAQIAYIMALYKYRHQTTSTMESMVASYAKSKSSSVGCVGNNVTIKGVRFIYDVNIEDGVSVEGASIIENATLCRGVRVGVDVKAQNFIAAENSVISGGAIVERCFVGESCILGSGFTAVDSLFFANSHCENGEAVSIFAGPYTVSHHKSSLLIAGMFSFFNAGSGCNQSNHLFKSGPVHQAIHRRGCKFASNGYVMSPALEAPFTTIIGRHTHHHDTSLFPYSILVERQARSVLMPGANLKNFGMERDHGKWPSRDKREHKRDVVNFEEHNPYVTQQFIKAIDTLNTIRDEDMESLQYNYNGVTMDAESVRRGIRMYTTAFVASLSTILQRGRGGVRCGGGVWLDVAGQFVMKQEVDKILNDVEEGRLSSFGEIDNRFRVLDIHYDEYAYDWAVRVLASIHGREIKQEDIDSTIESGEQSLARLSQMRAADRDKDCSLSLAIGYGLDSENYDDLIADFRVVRGLK